MMSVTSMSMVANRLSAVALAGMSSYSSTLLSKIIIKVREVVISGTLYVF